MFKHPTVIASMILSGGMLFSAILVCFFLHSMDVAIQQKFIPGSAPPPRFPDPVSVTSGNTPISVRVVTMPGDSPIPVKQVP